MPNQFSDLRGHPRSTAAPGRFPTPIPAESGPVPSDQGIGLDDNQYFFPTRPEPPQHDPEQPVVGSQDWTRVLPFEDGDLLPKSQDLQSEVASGTHQDAQGC